MKLSIIGFFIAAVTLLVVTLQFIFGNSLMIGNIGIVVFGFFIISVLLIFVAYKVYKATNFRKTRESMTWLFIFIGSIACFLLSLSSMTRPIIGSNLPEFSFISQTLSVVCYICFIVGFIFSMSYFKGNKKVNPWIPLTVISILSALVLFFLFKGISAQTAFGIGMTISFAIYILFDGIMLYLSWMNAALTWGGKLAVPYLIIAVGFVLLVVAHIQLVFASIGGSANVPINIITTPVFIIAVGVLALLM
ncbi:MAG: hypothetical protein R2883_08285 [Caldisericia bacterium]